MFAAGSGQLAGSAEAIVIFFLTFNETDSTESTLIFDETACVSPEGIIR